MDSKTCRICGRRLTNPVSVEREIGPICWENIQKEIIDEEEKEDDQ